MSLTLLFFQGGGQSNTLAPSTRMTFGAHQDAYYNSQVTAAKVFPSVRGLPIPPAGVAQFTSAPQSADLTLQPMITAASRTPPVIASSVPGFTWGPPQADLTIQAQVWNSVRTGPGASIGSEYRFGTHQEAYYASQIQAQVTPASVRGQTPPVISSFFAGQQTQDLSLKAQITLASIRGQTPPVIGAFFSGPQTPEAIRAQFTPASTAHAVILTAVPGFNWAGPQTEALLQAQVTSATVNRAPLPGWVFATPQSETRGALIVPAAQAPVVLLTGPVLPFTWAAPAQSASQVNASQFWQAIQPGTFIPPVVSGPAGRHRKRLYATLENGVIKIYETRAARANAALPPAKLVGRRKIRVNPQPVAQIPLPVLREMAEPKRFERLVENKQAMRLANLYAKLAAREEEEIALILLGAGGDLELSDEEIAMVLLHVT